MFENRRAAGKKLNYYLKDYKNNPAAIVLAIPNGGIEVGCEIAKNLNLDFNLIFSKKLSTVDNPELAFGAVVEDGSYILADDALQKNIEKLRQEKIQELKQKIDLLRDSKLSIFGKIVILVDDGIAMGFTMKAAVLMCKNKNASKIIVAVPVCSKDVYNSIKSMADDVFVIENPDILNSVSRFYKDFKQVSDKRVLEIMDSFPKS